MKKLMSVSFAALLVTLLASPGLAQNLSAGVKAGIGFANLGGEAEDLFGVSLDTRTGFSGGAFLGIDLHRSFRVQFDGQYVQKGAKFKEEGVDFTVKLDYLELMVPATLLIPTPGGQVTPRLFAGPALAIEMTCKFSGEQGGISADVDCDDPDIDVQRKSIDFGVFFGAGVDIGVGPGAITVDGLYNLGLTNVNDTPGTEEFSVKNQSIQLMVGYRFFFGR